VTGAAGASDIFFVWWKLAGEELVFGGRCQTWSLLMEKKKSEITRAKCQERHGARSKFVAVA
jgi:hypothetical protein